jgi:ribosomal 30S subunit maturation factor RimM
MRRRAQAPPGGVGVPEDEPPGGEELLEVGSVVRPHGLSGEVVVEFVTNRPERLESGSLLYTSGRELRIRTARSG